MNKGLNRKVINQLKYRVLEEEQFIIIMNYLVGNINWLEAHNKLIPLGINLTNDEVLIDY